ncbi:ERI1 [Mytilus edulis]|uniref:THEX1 n=1 Tax=Mytilus edulis TaxID=6550 RepID=A0A8S3ULC2_MYTED|nr:ERI1 [Mytilus edulis]
MLSRPAPTCTQNPGSPQINELLLRKDTQLIEFKGSMPWDMSRFMYHQCRQNKITYPRWGGKWINLRKAYSNFYQCRRTKLNDMLENLGMTFEGHLHSGLDDSRNIARIAIRLAEDGCELKVNEYLHYDRNENAFKSKHITPDSPKEVQVRKN